MASRQVISITLQKGAASMNQLIHVGSQQMMEQSWCKAFASVSDSVFVAAYESALRTCSKLPTIADVWRAQHELNRLPPSADTMPDLPRWDKQSGAVGKAWVELVKAGLNGDYVKKLELVATLRKHGVSESILQPIEMGANAALQDDRQEALRGAHQADLPHPLGRHAVNAAQFTFPKQVGSHA